jgi:hypothetical protein
MRQPPSTQELQAARHTPRATGRAPGARLDVAEKFQKRSCLRLPYNVFRYKNHSNKVLSGAASSFFRSDRCFHEFNYRQEKS